MKVLNAGIGALLGGLLLLTPGARDTLATRGNPTVIVGTFDSRGIAVAHAQSDSFREYLVAQQADIVRTLERARAAGDDELVAELEAMGPAMQKRLHEQGFGTAPVDDIIALIKDKLPGIAEEAGVDVIVSKWALDYATPEAKFVDVTGLIAAAFDPDERTLKMIQSTIETKPIPLDELEHDH